MSARLVQNAEINMRSNKPLLILDGEPFPFAIAKKTGNGRPGITVEVSDDNVHMVVVAIQVDRSVHVFDDSVAPYDDES